MNAEKKKIFLVDGNTANLTAVTNTLTEKYEVFSLPTSKELFHTLERVMPDIILLDVDIEMDGLEIIKTLKSHIRYCHIPVIFLISKDDGISELESLSPGAMDYIKKPFVPPLLLKRIEMNLLVEQQKRELKKHKESKDAMVREKMEVTLELQESVLKIVTELVESRDDISGKHIERTQKYLAILIRGLQDNKDYRDIVSHWDIEKLCMSSKLHDIGKIAIRDSILRKPGKLSIVEFEEMKNHVEFGVKIIEKMQENTRDKVFLEYAKVFAETHHEKWDGTGYPNGLSGNAIPLQGRLMAIVDVYDALISERPYKKAFTHDDAVGIIVAGKRMHFDPALVDIFLEHEQEFKKVTLNNG